jgi:hypothetical protein
MNAWKLFLPGWFVVIGLASIVCVPATARIGTRHNSRDCYSLRMYALTLAGSTS